MSNSKSLSPYTERVLPGLSYFASTLVVPVISWLVALPFGEMLSYSIALGLELVIVLLGVINAPVIQISAKNFKLGKAQISPEFISNAEVISKDQSFVEKGRALNPKAYVRFQFGVKGLVKVSLNDPNDPTPYWLFSSRNPDLVVKFLNAN